MVGRVTSTTTLFTPEDERATEKDASRHVIDIKSGEDDDEDVW